MKFDTKQVSKAFNKSADLAQLLFILVCLLVAQYAPVAGRRLGRLVGKTIVLGRTARAYYNVHLHQGVIDGLAFAEYTVRRFVAEQLGTHCMDVRLLIEPALSVLHIATEEGLDVVAATAESALETAIAVLPVLTRRECLVLAKERGLKGYSRLKTDQLRAMLV